MYTNGDYVSQNQDQPGTGSLTVAACAGLSQGQPDLFDLAINTGPFAGYQDSGALSKGDLKADS